MLRSCKIPRSYIHPSFPDTAKFLTPKERDMVVKRLQEDEQFSAAGEGFKWSSVSDSMKDWRMWYVHALSHVRLHRLRWFVTCRCGVSDLRARLGELWIPH